MNTRDLVPSLYIPVLLGDTAAHRRLARRLFWTYGLPVHLFESRLSPWRRLTPFLVCHPLPSQCSSAVRTLALTDFADEILRTDRQPVLLIAEEHLPLTQEEQQSLESQYLICTEAQLYELLAPPYTTKEECRYD